MKKPLHLALALAIALSACSSEQKHESLTESTEANVVEADAGAEAEVETPKEAVVLWSALGMRETPENKGKYLTTIYQGETVRLLGETEADKNSEKDTYTKVELSDGKVGWVLDRFVAADAKAAAITEDSEVYRRPDLLSKGDKKFTRMDFVAVLEENNEWVRVKGIPTGSNWFAEGWVLKSKITSDPVDISFAVLVNRAKNEKNAQKKDAEMKQVLSNSDLQGSQFYNDFQETETEGGDYEEGEYEDSSDSTDSAETSDSASSSEAADITTETNEAVQNEIN